MGECNAAYTFLYGKGTKHEILRGTRGPPPPPPFFLFFSFFFFKLQTSFLCKAAVCLLLEKRVGPAKCALLVVVNHSAKIIGFKTF